MSTTYTWGSAPVLSFTISDNISRTSGASYSGYLTVTLGGMQRGVVLRLFHQLHRGRDHRAIEGKQPQHMVIRNIQPQLLHLRQLYRQQHHHFRAHEFQQRPC